MKGYRNPMEFSRANSLELKIFEPAVPDRISVVMVTAYRRACNAECWITSGAERVDVGATPASRANWACSWRDMPRASKSARTQLADVARRYSVRERRMATT